MMEVLAQAAQPASQDGIVWYLVTAAATGLIGMGGAMMALGRQAGNFLAPLILRVTESHVQFLHKIEATAENQVEATKTLAGCVDTMRNENSATREVLAQIHKAVQKDTN